MGLSLVMLLFLFTNGEQTLESMKDPDLWWHLRDASDLFRTGHFIHTDTWSLALSGRPWINFEWLAELPYYFAYQWLGLRGPYLVMLLLVSAILVGIYALGCLRSRDSKAAFLASFLGLQFVSISLGPRTLLFGWLFLVIELGILWGLERGRDSTVWLPPLFLVWINTHGSWMIGFVLMVLFFACGFVRGEWGQIFAVEWTGRQKKKLALVAAASFAVLFINPYGWHLVAYPLDVAFHQKLTIENVREWSSLDFHTLRGKVTLATLVLLGVLQMVHRRRWRLQNLMLALIAIYGGLTYVRFLFMMGIVMTPLMAEELRGLVGPDGKSKNRRLVNAAMMAAMAMVMLHSVAPEKKLEASVADTFPVKALPYLHSIAGTGNVFNDFGWGGWLVWNVPEMKDFIDSRVDIFVHDGVMQDYLDATEIHRPFEVLDRYRIRYVFMDRKSALAWVLGHSTAWKMTYKDERAVAFERAQ